MDARFDIEIVGEAEIGSYLEFFNAQWPFCATTPQEHMHELAAHAGPGRHRHWLVRERGRGQSSNDVGDGAAAPVVAVAACEAPVWTPGSISAEVTIIVDPACRHSGIGAELYRRASVFARELELQSLRISTFENEREGIAWLARHGFTEVERQLFVALDLRAASAYDLPHAALPSGLAIVSLADRPDLRRAYHEVLAEAVPDIPGDEVAAMLPFEHWASSMDTSPVYRTESCFLVIDDSGEALAVAELEYQALLPLQAWHGFTAVRAKDRRRGIARALKRHTIENARDALGLARLVTENEVRNVGMRAINHDFGYEPLPSGLVWRGPLALDS